MKEIIRAAYELYNKAIKCLCLILFKDHDGDPLIKELAVNLNLNSAMCALKLRQPGKAIKLCSIVMGIDSKNVKALFRRAIALKEVGNLDGALEDLRKARELEPKNTTVLKEVEEIKKEKKTEDLRKGVVGAQGVLKNQTKDHLQGQESSSNLSEEKLMVKDSNMGFQGEWSRKKCMEQEEISQQPNAVEDSMVIDDSNKQGMEISQIEPVQTTPHNKPILSNHPHPHITFANRKRPNSFLKLSRADLDLLREGKELQFYQPNSLSFLKVRTFKPEISISMEAPRECHSREAEVSKVSSTFGGTLPKNNLELTGKDKGIPQGNDAQGVNQPQMLSVQSSCETETSFYHPNSVGMTFQFSANKRTRYARGQRAAKVCASHRIGTGKNSVSCLSRHVCRRKVSRSVISVKRKMELNDYGGFICPQKKTALCNSSLIVSQCQQRLSNLVSNNIMYVGSVEPKDAHDQASFA